MGQRGDACLRYRHWHHEQRCFVCSPHERLAVIQCALRHVRVLNAALGSPQSIIRVSQWPGQEIDARASKIPSRLFYSPNLQVGSSSLTKDSCNSCAITQSQVRLVGAEATGFDAEVQAEDNDWILVEHFKLLLHPKELRSQHHIRCPPSKTQPIILICHSF